MNVLFIAIDELKPVLGCYGDRIIKTPNIDKLAAKGTVFMQNYCQQAVCGSTHASLITCKHPNYTKVWDLKPRMLDINPDILTIPQYFGQQGYTTQGIGKIYVPRFVDTGNFQDKALDKELWSDRYFCFRTSLFCQRKRTCAVFYTLNEIKQSRLDLYSF